MILMTLKKKKNKRFYSLNAQQSSKKHSTIYLVYTFDEIKDKIVSDEPYDDPLDAKEAMEGYLSQGRCAWIATYNE